MQLVMLAFHRLLLHRLLLDWFFLQIQHMDTVGAGASLSVATQNPSPELVATVQPGHCQGVDPVGAVGDVGFPSVATPSVAS